MRVASAVIGLLLSSVLCTPSLAQDPTTPKPQEKPTKPDPEKKSTDLGTMTVEGKIEKRYAPKEGSSATRTSTPLREIPGSIQVIPEAVMEDQAVWRLKDVYRNVSGVHPFKTEGFAVTFESAFLRGFAQNPYLNGARTYGLGPVDLQGIERVEILKGPSSVLYGAIEPGGVINLVPKTAFFDARYKASFKAGSYDFYRGSFDINTPIDDERTMGFRLNGAYQNSGSFRDHLTDESIFVSPSFSWKISDDTRMSAWLWYQHQDKPVDDGVAFSAAGSPVASVSTFLGDPDHNTQRIDDFFGGISFEHDFDDSMTFRQEVQAHSFDSEMDAIRRFGGTSATNTVSPFYDAGRFTQWDLNSRSELVVRAATGSVDHQILVGLQGFIREYEFERRRDTTSVPAISITNPQFPSLDYTINNQAPPASQDVAFLSLYAQDQMTLLDDSLHLVAGLRLDYIDQSNPPVSQDDWALTWKLGALYDVTEWASVFADVSTSFNPTRPGRMTVDGSTLDPETGVQFEAGVKFSLLEDRLRLTATAYQITKDDVTIADPNNAGFSLNGGKMRSRGFEFDAAGEIVEGLSLIGSYAYTDTEVLDSDSLPEGGRFRGIPLHSGSLWLRYHFGEWSSLDGLAFGAGVFASSAKEGDNAGSFELPSYARFDLSASYDLELSSGKQLKFQLNVLNVFDEEYYESSFNVARVQPGQSLTVLGGVSITF